MCRVQPSGCVARQSVTGLTPNPKTGISKPHFIRSVELMFEAAMAFAVSLRQELMTWKARLIKLVGQYR